MANKRTTGREQEKDAPPVAPVVQRRASGRAPGKGSRSAARYGSPVQQPGAVQRRASAQGEGAEAGAVREAAAEGVKESGGALPHLEQIQGSFGEHDVTGVSAHLGGKAADACEEIGAEAYATGDEVAFKGAPDLHTAAHEAAHVVQQRAGVQLKGGVGETGDAYERNADAVADRVVAGRSAEDLLASFAAPSSDTPATQRKAAAVQRDDEETVSRGGRAYVIQRGDNLSRIAARFYGHTRYWRDIMRANPDKVRDNGNLIITGQTLQLPRLQVPASLAPAINLDEISPAPGDPTNPATAEAEAQGVCLPRDYRETFEQLDALDSTERRQLLLDLRTRGEWDAFLAALDESHVARVQAWLPAEEGQDGNYTLEERIEQAGNSDRGRAALAAVDGIAANDTNDPPRITERIREILSLGVALPALEGNDLAAEGVLTVRSATRAAEALLLMPPKEYMRISMQLGMVGSQSAWVQQFNLLKAVAARRDQFGDADSANDSLAQLDTFADDIRNMDEDELVRQTNVQQIDPGQGGLEQTFTMSCNVTAAIVVRAQADPVEAMRLHQNNEMSRTNLGGEVAGQTEQALENHGGNVAVARSPQQTTADVNGAIMALITTAPADQLLAVSNYMSNQAFDAGKYAAGIAKVRSQLARDGYPNDQAMRIVRETAAGGAQPGLTPGQLSTEMTGSLGVDDVTGQTGGVDWDATLWSLYTADNNGDGVADRIVPSPVPSTWTTRISAMLGRARPRIEAGEDITFNVYWNGGGGHTMTFTNVRDVGGTVSFLVHDTWTGLTTWVTQANILQGNWPGGSRGVICGMIG